MAAAGLGDDLLVANEVVDPRRLEALAALADEARITIAVDSEATIAAAALAGIRSCLDRRRRRPARAAAATPPTPAASPTSPAPKGLEVRGVMGYEGHLMALEDRAEQREQVEAAMATLLAAHGDVGGEIISAGGTGTYDIHATTGVTEVQAGSYALMDTAYAKLGLPFAQALFVVGTVIAVRPDHAVADVGLKALGMDHGNPSIDGAACGSAATSTSRSRPATSARPSAIGSASSRPTSTRRWRCTRSPGSSTATTCSSAGRSTSAAGDDHAARAGAAWIAVAGMAATAVLPVGEPAVRNRSAPRSRSLMPWSALSAVPLAVGAALDRPPPRSPSPPAPSAPPASRWPRRWSCRAASRRPTRRRAPLRDHARQPALRQPPRRGRARRARPARRRRRSRSASSRRRHCRRLHATSLIAALPAPHRAAPPRLAQRHRAVEPLAAAPPSRSTPTATTRSSPTSTRPAARCSVIVDPHPEPDRPPRRVGGATSPSSATCRPPGPAVMTGDFNASWWHPELRGVMRAGGWRDAHQVVGRGLSCSWPTEQWHPAFRAHPPFVRLDHALVNDGLRRARRRRLRRPRQRSPRASSSPCSELGQQRPERPAAVGHGVLLVLAHLGERAPVAVVGDEHGVVAEAPRRPARRSAMVPSQTPSTASSRPSGHTTMATVRNRARRSATPSQRGRAAWPGCRRTVASVAGVARGAHAGRARRGRRPPARCRRRRPARRSPRRSRPP